MAGKKTKGLSGVSNPHALFEIDEDEKASLLKMHEDFDNISKEFKQARKKSKVKIPLNIKEICTALEKALQGPYQYRLISLEGDEDKIKLFSLQDISDSTNIKRSALIRLCQKTQTIHGDYINVMKLLEYFRSQLE